MSILMDLPILIFKISLSLIELPFDMLKRVFQFWVHPSKKSITEDVVLVTGAASGIGRLMALKFSRQGAKLIVCWDVNSQGNEETVKLIRQNGGKAIGLACNLAKHEAVVEAATKTKEEIRKALNDKEAHVTILVNNAGIVTGKKFLDCKPELMSLTMDVNTTAHFWTLREFLPDMFTHNKGHVVTIASGAGLAGLPGMVDYCASKFGAVGLSESLYMEIANQQKDVKVTTICPYFISTGMFEGVKNRYPWLLPVIQPEEMAEKIVSATRQNKEFIIHPPVLWLLHFLKPMLGNHMYRRTVEILEVNRAMDAFVGRAGKGK